MPAISVFCPNFKPLNLSEKDILGVSSQWRRRSGIFLTATCGGAHAPTLGTLARIDFKPSALRTYSCHGQGGSFRVPRGCCSQESLIHLGTRKWEPLPSLVRADHGSHNLQSGHLMSASRVQPGPNPLLYLGRPNVCKVTPHTAMPQLRAYSCPGWCTSLGPGERQTGCPQWTGRSPQPQAR